MTAGERTAQESLRPRRAPLDGGAAGLLRGLRRRAAAGPRLAVAAFAVTAAAQVAYPLAAGQRAALATLVVAAEAVCAVSLAAAAWGAGRAAAAAALVGGLTLVAEATGVRTGWPFGDYAYSSALRPQLAGVPLIVPIAWCAMALPAREVAARIARGAAGRAAAGGVCLAAWDLFLDPQMLREGFWRWSAGGRYHGIPLTNFAGWMLVGALAVAAADALAPPRARSAGLLGLCAWSWAMETVAFAVFFGGPDVALAGGVAMGVPLLLALRRA